MDERALSEKLREHIRFNKELDDVYHSIAKRLGLSDSALDILYAIHIVGEGHKQTELAEYCWSSRTTIHSSIKKMEQDGLLRVDRSAPRETKVFLTPKGRTLVDEEVARVMEAEVRAFKASDPFFQTFGLATAGSFVKCLREETKDLR